MLRLLTTLAFATMALPRPGAAQCSDLDRKALEAFDRAWTEATNRGDRAYLQSAYADDYMNLGVAMQQGKAQTIDDAVRQAEWNRANPSAAPKVGYGQYVIHCTPTTATITHRNEITSAAGGKEQTTYSRSIHNLEKRGGRWQVVSNAAHSLGDVGILQYMERDWNDALRRRDAAWMERNFTDDFTTIESSGAFMNKAEAIASLRADRTSVESIDLSDLVVRVDGNAAVVTGVNRWRGRDAQGSSIDRRVRFTDTFIKRDGRWLAWASQGTRIP